MVDAQNLLGKLGVVNDVQTYRVASARYTGASYWFLAQV